MLKKILIAVSAAATLSLSAYGQSGDNGYTGAWLPYRGDALGSAAGTNIAASTNITLVTGAPVIHMRPNTYIAFYPSFNLATNIAAASVSNVTFFFAYGPGLYTNGAGNVQGSTNMTTAGLSFSNALTLTGTTNAIGCITINPTNLIGGVIQFLGASTSATNVGGVTISNMPYFYYGQQ